ncbi:hypothetical protein [Nakamurella sp.]|uniref:hypothetical protein n=1 Tax=Nakamurella sp. TaxID=1869182 RepID=UPI003B3A3B08
MSAAPVVRPWLRPGFALVAAQDHWYVCDPLGRSRALRGEARPAGLGDPRSIDPVVHRDFLAGLAAAGIAAVPGRGRGVDRRAVRGGRAPRRAAARNRRSARGHGSRPGPGWPVGALIGGPPEFTRPLSTLLGRRGVRVRHVAALPAGAPPGSLVVWAGPEPFGPAAAVLDAAAGRGELCWVRLTVDGRRVDLEPVARGAGDVTHAMVRQRRLAAERRPAVAQARWSGAAVRGPVPITPAVGRLLAGLVVADLGRTSGSRVGPGWRPMSGRSRRIVRPAPIHVEPRFRLRRIDLLTGAGSDHWILPVPPADLRGEPA